MSEGRAPRVDSRGMALYLHIPLCVRKCAYCDFTSYTGHMPQRAAYVQAVCGELRAQAAFFGRRRVQSVFLGGGTPTLLPGAEVAALMETVREVFDLAPDAEISMEGNPGTLTPDNLRAYRAAGVNRLSLGVQSFDDGLLRTLGRIHTARQAEQAVAMARAAGFANLNLDLMNGLPGQTPAQWRETLEHAIALAPEHLSCYNLIVEEGTPLAASLAAGACAPLPDEDAMCAMDALTEQWTRAAGYARYEVSNYAKAGFACRHNIVYWSCLPYLGVGCAAHSDLDGRRFANPDGWADYLRIASRGGWRSAEGDGTRDERMFERMMMGLRMVRGVDARRFAADFGCSPRQTWPNAVARLVDGGLMRETPDAVAMTPDGLRVLNAALVTLLEEQDARRG